MASIDHHREEALRRKYADREILDRLSALLQRSADETAGFVRRVTGQGETSRGRVTPADVFALLRSKEHLTELRTVLVDVLLDPITEILLEIIHEGNADVEQEPTRTREGDRSRQKAIETYNRERAADEDERGDAWEGEDDPGEE